MNGLKSVDPSHRLMDSNEKSNAVVMNFSDNGKAMLIEKWQKYRSQEFHAHLFLTFLLMFTHSFIELHSFQLSISPSSMQIAYTAPVIKIGNLNAIRIIKRAFLKIVRKLFRLVIKLMAVLWCNFFLCFYSSIRPISYHWKYSIFVPYLKDINFKQTLL